MQRLTGGQPHYFKKRIRLALLTVTQSQPAVFIYGGKEVQGQQIEFTPYVNDPLKPRFGKLDVKRYIFILSADVPGYVYQIRTVAPDTDPNNTLIEEVLTLDSVTGKK